MKAPHGPPARTRSIGRTPSERKHLAFSQRSEHIDWFHGLDLASMKRLRKAWAQAKGGKP
jgi:hypothetical protein